jgi:hypothetical protein
MKTEISIAVRQPRLSARRANSHPPIGRIRKPAANAPAVFNGGVQQLRLRVAFRKKR